MTLLRRIDYVAFQSKPATTSMLLKGIAKDAVCSIHIYSSQAHLPVNTTFACEPDIRNMIPTGGKISTVEVYDDGSINLYITSFPVRRKYGLGVIRVRYLWRENKESTPIRTENPE